MEMQMEPQAQRETALSRFVRKTRDLFAQEPDLDMPRPMPKFWRPQNTGRTVFPPMGGRKTCCSMKIPTMVLP